MHNPGPEHWYPAVRAGGGLASVGLINEIEAHNDFARRSRVHPLVVETSGLCARLAQTAAPASSDRTAPSWALEVCEWVNGHIGRDPTGRRTLRPSPSAGGLHPIDIVVVQAGQSGTVTAWCHDPAHNRLIPLGSVADDRADRIRADLVLLRGETAFVLVAALWRSVQRYGARGFRYCLVDAGAMAHHLTLLLSEHGSDAALVTPNCGPEMQSLLGLELAEHVACAVVTSSDAVGGWRPEPPPWLAAGQSLPQVKRPVVAEPPVLAAALTRAVRIARVARAGDAQRVDANPHPALTVPTFEYLCERRSAKRFDPTPVSVDAIVAGMRSVLAASPWVGPQGLAIHTLRRGSAHLEWQNVIEACHGQALLANAAALLVITANNSSDHGSYARSALAAGYLAAGLYAVCWRAEVATTTIGGFDDGALRDLIRDVNTDTTGPVGRPLLAQAIGTPVSSGPEPTSNVGRARDEKVDRAVTDRRWQL